MKNKKTNISPINNKEKITNKLITLLTYLILSTIGITITGYGSAIIMGMLAIFLELEIISTEFLTRQIFNYSFFILRITLLVTYFIFINRYLLKQFKVSILQALIVGIIINILFFTLGVFACAISIFTPCNILEEILNIESLVNFNLYTILPIILVQMLENNRNKKFAIKNI